MDFEKLLEGDREEVQKFRLGGKGADVVIVTLGTTKANAGSMEKFVRIVSQNGWAAVRDMEGVLKILIRSSGLLFSGQGICSRRS